MEHLINDVVFNTNNQGESRYSPIRLLKHFNDAQRTIQSIILSVQMDSRNFSKTGEKAIPPEDGYYKLPADCFGANSIVCLKRKERDYYGYYGSIPLISEKEYAEGCYGYVVRGDRIYIIDDYEGLRDITIVYNSALPNLSHRLMKIESISRGSISPDEESFIEQEKILDFSDNVSIVDDLGTILESGIRITGQEGEDNSLLIDESTLPLPGRSNGFKGMWVCLGGRSTTHSALPDVLENILCAYVERRIKGVDKQMAEDKAYNSGTNMYEEEVRQVRELFTKVDDDIGSPPIHINASNYGYYD